MATLTEIFTSIANAIREKENSTNSIPAGEFASRINAIPKIITSTTEIEEGSASNYPNGTLYIVYEEA